MLQAVLHFGGCKESDNGGLLASLYRQLKIEFLAVVGARMQRGHFPHAA